MQNDTVDRVDRTDLCRMADDGCPHADESKTHDLAELRAALGRDYDEIFSRGIALDRPAAIARLDPQLLIAVSLHGSG